MYSRNRRIVVLLTMAVALVWALLASLSPPADAFVVWLGNTTACDTCDEPTTYSGRNVMCCLIQSKCCGPTSFDEEGNN